MGAQYYREQRKAMVWIDSRLNLLKKSDSFQVEDLLLYELQLKFCVSEKFLINAIGRAAAYHNFKIANGMLIPPPKAKKKSGADK